MVAQSGLCGFPLWLVITLAVDVNVPATILAAAGSGSNPPVGNEESTSKPMPQVKPQGH